MSERLRIAAKLLAPHGFIFISIDDKEAAHKWSYTEWQNQIDRLSDDEATLIESGTPKEWFMETAELCKGIYEATPEGTNVSYDYIDRFTTLIEQQFVKGGHRLAKLLNEIYE